MRTGDPNRVQRPCPVAEFRLVVDVPTTFRHDRKKDIGSIKFEAGFAVDARVYIQQALRELVCPLPNPIHVDRPSMSVDLGYLTGEDILRTIEALVGGTEQSPAALILWAASQLPSVNARCRLTGDPRSSRAVNGWIHAAAM